MRSRQSKAQTGNAVQALASNTAVSQVKLSSVFAPRVLQPATLRFLSDWQELVHGSINRGEPLSIEYDPARLPQCRQNWRGAEVWDIEAFVRFHPRGEIVRGGVLKPVREPPEFGMVVGLEPAPLQVPVPSDATQIELWFHNFYQTSSRCDAWDSRFGQNYWFEVSGDSPTVPRQPVSYRTGAIASSEMVNVARYSIVKENVFPQLPNSPRAGWDLQTVLTMTAWVRNVAYTKNVWIDVHVFDGLDNLVHSETFTLRYAGTASGWGDLFDFDGRIYHGSTATPGSVSPRPEARKVQYRLYYEVNSQVYTDAILHQQDLPADAVIG